jgi:hypothetical protein
LVYQADLIGFFRTILIIILIYYAFRILFRVALPFILKFFAKKVQKNFENQYKQQQGFQEENIKSEEGEIKVTIPKKPSKPKHDGSTGGEYIDFEEVE